jgi:hypothetical protein
MAGVKGAKFLAEQDARWEAEYVAEENDMRNALQAMVETGSFPTEAPKEAIHVALDASWFGSNMLDSVLSLTEYEGTAATLVSHKTARASNVQEAVLRHIDGIRAKHLPAPVIIRVQLTNGVQTDAGRAALAELKAALAERGHAVVEYN